MSFTMKMHTTKPLVFFLYILFMQKGDTICMLAQAKIVSSNQTFMI